VEKFTLNAFEVPASEGLQKTIATMQFLEKLSINNPAFVSYVYKNFYTDCAACLPGKIWRYMQEKFIYRHDEPFDELVIAPHVMVEIKTGDCDDFSLFAKTVFDIVGGWYSNYVLFGREKNKFTHIAVLAHRGQYGKNFRDAVLVDGTNSNFDVYNSVYKYLKVI